MTYLELQKSLKKKEFAPLYLLQGEEAYYIDAVADFIEENSLTEDQKSFNMTILYGKDINWQTVVDAARRYPIMAERQVVIVKEAQMMKDIAQLEKYAENPSATTVVVLCYKYGNLDKRTKFAKAIEKNAVVMDAPKMYESQVPDFIKKYLQEKGLDIDPQPAALIAESLGNDLAKLTNELDKLTLNIAKGTPVTAELIHKYIGISKDFNVFELQTALAKRDAGKAIRIVNYFIANPKENPLVKTIASLYGYFSKIYITASKLHSSDDDLGKALNIRFAKFLIEYRQAAAQYPLPKTEKVIALLKEYDLKSKGVNRDSATEGDLLKELIFKILNT
jgi:DNA polymerase-3 subunit delta